MDYKSKYEIYKAKYLKLKQQTAGSAKSNASQIITTYKESMRKRDFPLPQITNQLTQSPVIILDNFR